MDKPAVKTFEVVKADGSKVKAKVIRPENFKHQDYVDYEHHMFGEHDHLMTSQKWNINSNKFANKVGVTIHFKGEAIFNVNHGNHVTEKLSLVDSKNNVLGSVNVHITPRKPDIEVSHPATEYGEKLIRYPKSHKLHYEEPKKNIIIKNSPNASPRTTMMDL